MPGPAHSPTHPSRWHILTGEYPPQAGGVSDYSRRLALALARAGDRVDVWAPEAEGTELELGGASVHRVAHPFTPSGLRRLDRELSLAGGGVLLVQYVPSAFGFRAMNVPFALWLASRPEPLWVMFHEVAHPVGLRLPPGQTARGLVNRAMAAIVLRRAGRVLVSTSAWTRQLERLGARRPVTELPIPSNLPERVAPEDVAAARASVAAPGEVLIGHFGTYGPLLAPMLLSVLPRLLGGDARRKVLLVGRGSGRFAAALGDGGRTLATGPLEQYPAAVQLAACDVLLQPFPDGATTRRTTLMAGLALGKPVVTNAGQLSEPFWAPSGAVALAPSPRPDDIAATAEALLQAPDRWATLGERARHLYAERFSLERTVAALRGAAA